MSKPSYETRFRVNAAIRRAMAEQFVDAYLSFFYNKYIAGASNFRYDACGVMGDLIGVSESFDEFDVNTRKACDSYLAGVGEELSVPDAIRAEHGIAPEWARIERVISNQEDGEIRDAIQSMFAPIQSMRLYDVEVRIDFADQEAPWSASCNACSESGWKVNDKVSASPSLHAAITTLASSVRRAFEEREEDIVRRREIRNAALVRLLRGPS